MHHLQFKGQKVLIRVDFNVPMDDKHQITDDTRIQATLPTIKFVLDHGGAVILLSHLGRPLKKLLPDGTIDRSQFTLSHLTNHLEDLTDVKVHFAKDCIGEVAQDAVNKLNAGEILLLENTRFHVGEEKGDPGMASKLAALGDIYINDAFGTAHRAHASTAIIARSFPPDKKAFGFLMKAELENAKQVMDNPKRPLIAIVGGAKVSDKMLLLDKLLDQVDALIIGGGMAYTFVKARGGHIGDSLVEMDRLNLALELLAKAKSKKIDLLLPQDSVIANKFAPDAETQIVESDQIPDGWKGLDIGPAARKTYTETISKAKTILWNGPMGVFEMAPFAKGTFKIAQAIAQSTEKGAFSLVGGGDSVTAVNQMHLSDKVSFVSTGGGALLELLEGKELPGVTAIQG